MATHRRGLRPAQWPVRDLLSEQRSRTGALRDPRLYAAVGGLLACGAAATVAFTAGDGIRDPAPGPMALPVPNAVVPAPANPLPYDPEVSDPGISGPGVSGPGISDPAPSGGGSAGGPGPGPAPRAWQQPGGSGPAPATVPQRKRGTPRTESVRDIADRVAAELVRIQARSSRGEAVEGLLVVPSQRGGQVTALVKRVPAGALCPASERTAGRHRAPESDDDRDDDRKRDRGGKHARDDDGDRDEDKKSDRDEDKKSDRDDEKKSDRDEDKKRDRDRDDDEKKSDRDEDKKRDRDRDDDDEKSDRDRDDKKSDRDDDDEKHDRDRDDRGSDRAGKHAKGGDADDRDADDRDTDDRDAERPAMATLATSASDDRGGDLGGRSIDSDALLAALADL